MLPSSRPSKAGLPSVAALRLQIMSITISAGLLSYCHCERSEAISSAKTEIASSLATPRNDTSPGLQTYSKSAVADSSICPLRLSLLVLSVDVHPVGGI